MNDYRHYPEKIIAFTEKSPPCPKCGNIDTKRFFRKGSQGYGTPYYGMDWIVAEFLEVICQECRYSFPQNPQDAKRKEMK